MLTDTTQSPNVAASPLPSQNVHWTKGFWKDAEELNSKVTIPQLKKMFESPEISHVVENFRICAGETEGKFGGTDFGDGDFYKWMEAAMYSAVENQEEEQLQELEKYIALIGKAQEADGYISTKQIISDRGRTNPTRFENINDFEVYNFGHLFTAAALYKRLTGRESLLKIAEKAAGCLEQMYRTSEENGHVKTAVCPSHYMGLIELYRVTDNIKYLDLAERAIELRDQVIDGMDDNQDRIPLKKHEKIIGHAVRANYLYAGVADLCLEREDDEYLKVLHRIWRNLTDQKLYLTGGCGALYNGASPYGDFFHHQLVHQAYGYEYQLPNITAYNETCANIGLVLFAYRMFQLEPKVEYMDVIERVMCNANLAAVSLDGKKFFYENMLRREEELPYKLVWPTQRSEYILSYCCPPNLARTIAESSEYTYLVSSDKVYFGMYGASEASFKLNNGADFTIVQETKYPYEGSVIMRIENRTPDREVSLMLRIPGWCEHACLKTDKTIKKYDHSCSGTYIEYKIPQETNTKIELILDMPVRLTIAHPMVEETANQAAVERGPLVYCLESVDAGNHQLSDLYLSPEDQFDPVDIQIHGRKIKALFGEFRRIVYEEKRTDDLYQRLPRYHFDKQDVKLIPYFAWDNREYGQMRVYLPLLLEPLKGGKE